MPAHKGHDGQGGGRPPGSPNKATSKAREAIASFVDGNAHRLSSWLDAIAAENPRAAFDCFMSVVEYHIPKLARNENVNVPSKEGLGLLDAIELARLVIALGRTEGFAVPATFSRIIEAEDGNVSPVSETTDVPRIGTDISGEVVSGGEPIG